MLRLKPGRRQGRSLNHSMEYTSAQLVGWLPSFYCEGSTSKLQALPSPVILHIVLTFLYIAYLAATTFNNPFERSLGKETVRSQRYHTCETTLLSSVGKLSSSTSSSSRAMQRAIPLNMGDFQGSTVTLSDLPSSKQHFMLMAAEEASKSVLREKHGCIIVRGGEIVARGHNKHVMQISKGKVSCHAEKDAILRCRKKIYLRDADLYVVRWGKNIPGNPVIMYSAPCAACVALIRSCMKKYGLRHVYYSLDSIQKANRIYPALPH
mmetsp:Transcript_39282/g.65868  ORF Transcript_39282/g.65868 Transcript_39282/m.65868 type:complete len:265 (+) Transcript_39282:106-900(+)